MLTENDVIVAIKKYLEKSRYTIVSSADTKMRGTDIIAVNNSGAKLYLEAKGETSSKENTQRYNKPFNSSQVNTHVSVAVTRCMQELNKSLKIKQAIGLPLTRLHVAFVEKIRGPLSKLGIEVYWVDKNKVVTVLK